MTLKLILSFGLLYCALFCVILAEETPTQESDLLSDLLEDEEHSSTIQDLVDLICTCRNEQKDDEPTIPADTIDPMNPCPFPRDCKDILDLGQTKSGRYDIFPYGAVGHVRVWCDMDTDGGGWTVFQRREDGQVDFFRNWIDYKNGFGSVSAEHWLGNDNLHLITDQQKYDLRVDLADFEGETRYATYDYFSIGDEESFYTLYLGAYDGNAGDSLTNQALSKFSTKDVDNDKSSGNCARDVGTGAWWYNYCHLSNLNGQYLRGDRGAAFENKGVTWDSFQPDEYSLKFTEMKIRPGSRM